MIKEERHAQLKKKLTIAEQKLTKALEEQGEACGNGCDWHDNNAYDLARSLADTYQVIVDELKKEIEVLTQSK